jgi:opacity protein-like surface antigen
MKKILLSVLSITICSINANAKSGFYVSGGLGYSKANLLSKINVLNVKLNSDYETEWDMTYHAALGYEIPIMPFRLEAEYSTGSADYDKVTFTGNILDFLGDDSKVFSNVSGLEGSYTAYMANAYGMIPGIPVVKPYIGVGLGMVTAEVDDMTSDTADAEMESSFGWQAMIGVEIQPPVLPFGISAEYRYLSTDGDVKDDPNQTIELDIQSFIAKLRFIF